jgi:glycosyltransferase involved in cell wall biosynthesis
LCAENNAEMKTLHLIIPCYNPMQDNWHENIVEQFLVFKNSFRDIQVSLTIVNDGAAHGIEQKHFDYFSSQIPDVQIVSYEKNIGKGFALRQGIATASADYYIFTDIDFPYENQSMVDITNVLIQKNGIAVGFRNQNYYQKVPLFRRILSKSFRVFIRFLGIPVQDTQCGLKAFDNAAKTIFLQTTINRYLFDFEFLYLSARQKNIPIYHVDVTLKDGVIFSTMGLSVLRKEAYNLLKILLK